jgi:hypothetical protein
MILRMKSLLSFGLILVASIGVFSPVMAQDGEWVYSTKFVCGFQVGDIPLLSDEDPFPHAYEALKPGNYATTVNIFNATPFVQKLYPQISYKNKEGKFVVIPLYDAEVSIKPYQTPCVPCGDIVDAIRTYTGDVLSGEAFEGIVFIRSKNQAWDVRTVNTYASQNAFERHLVWGLNQNGSIAVVRTFTPVLIPGGSVVFPINFQVFDIAGSGAGGLGLGASIDVNYVDPRFVDFELVSPKRSGTETVTPQGPID